MARKSPLGKIRDAALDTIKDPIGSGQKAVGQAKGTVELGKAVAGQVTGSAISRATGTVSAVTSLVPGLRKQGPSEPLGSSEPSQDPIARKTAEPPAGNPVTPAAPATKKAAAKKAPVAKKASSPDRAHGDPVKPAKATGTTGTTKTAKAAKTAAAPSKGTASPASGTTSTEEPVRAPVEDVATAAVKKAATQAPTGKGALNKTATKRATKKTAKKAAPADNAIDAAADTTDVDVTPADIAASVAKKAPATKAPTAKKTPTAKRTASGDVPLSAAELAGGAGTEAITPAGTRGAGVPSNPDTAETGFDQPGDAPLVTPGETKAVASEADTLGRASDTDKG